MKKIIAIVAAAVALLVSSCQPLETGTVMYHVQIDESFFDNMDILAYGIDEGFAQAGLKKMEVGAHYWTLEGEKNACNKKASAAFLARCQAIDKDRSLLALPLAIKGVKVTLIYTYSGDHELTSYTFKEEN